MCHLLTMAWSKVSRSTDTACVECWIASVGHKAWWRDKQVCADSTGLLGDGTSECQHMPFTSLFVGAQRRCSTCLYSRLELMQTLHRLVSLEMYNMSIWMPKGCLRSTWSDASRKVSGLEKWSHARQKLCSGVSVWQNLDLCAVMHCNTDYVHRSLVNKWVCL